MNKAIGKYRWTICSLLFFATTVNYLDRAVISLLKPYLAADFGWTPAQEAGNYADIEMAFKLSYAIGMLFAGRLIDKLGTRIGYALATVLWSVAAICHAFAKGTVGFMIARTFLGITESGNFPSAIKATAEWFPKKERALATGIFNSGSNIGAIAAPLSVPLIADNWGWQWAFIITGAIGFIWLILWFIYYEVPRMQKRLSAEELAYIESDKEDIAVAPDAEQLPRISWSKLLTYRQTWAFAIGKFLTDPVWWFYLFWLPDFLRKQYHLTSKEIMWPTDSCLYYFQYWQYWRWLVAIKAHQQRLACIQSKEDKYADLCFPGDTDRICPTTWQYEYVVRSSYNRIGGGGSPGMERQYFYDRIRYVSQKSYCFCNRYWRTGRRTRRRFAYLIGTEKNVCSL